MNNENKSKYDAKFGSKSGKNVYKFEQFTNYYDVNSVDIDS